MSTAKSGRACEFGNGMIKTDVWEGRNQIRRSCGRGEVDGEVEGVVPRRRNVGEDSA